MFYKNLSIFSLSFFLALGLWGQDSTKTNFGYVILDPLVVTASRSDFSVAEFIDLVRNDKTFYQAFKNIRTLSYSADNQLLFYNKKQEVKASYTSTTHQTSDGDCRTMEVVQETVTGKYFKRKRKLRYYTARMYDRLFFTHGRVCEKQRTAAEISRRPRGMAKHVAELKKLIFYPGEKASVPFIGNKTEIFSERMAKYYDYRISSKAYHDGTPCYVFSVRVKPEYLKRKTGKTVVKYLETYFEKSNFQILGRRYQLRHSGALFDFDVEMQIELKKIGNRYVPSFLTYDGQWDIPTRKREICRFEARLYNYHIPD